MTVEISLLKTLAVRSNFDQYLKLLNTKLLSIQSITLLKEYQDYFSLFKEHETINFGEFRSMFFIQKNPSMDEKQALQYKQIIDLIEQSPIEDGYRTLMAFEQQEFYSNLQRDLDKNIDNKELSEKVEEFVTKIDQLKDSKKTNNEDMDLIAALIETDRSKGLQWRLNCLNRHFEGGPIKGDFILVAGFVDSGKTSFVASEVSYMASQLKDDEWIAWLNTEGSWQQVIPRIYCATLNCMKQDLTKWPNEAILKYERVMKGNKNRIKVLNFQRKTIKDVEKLIKKNPPKLIVFDLLDHIGGFKSFDGDTVEQYGHLYQWARTIATEICPVIAISQLNRNGNNEPYPMMTELSGSGEKKQAAATAMILIGSVQGNDTDRFLSTPKNKIGGGKGFRVQVKFDPLRSRFID